MGIRLGKKNIGIVIGKEDLITELNTQDSLLADLENDINNLPPAGSVVIEGIEIDLPEAFANVANIYYFKVNNKILFSGYTNGVTTSVGLWVYNMDNKEWKQINSNVYAWSTFQQVTEHKVLIASSNLYSTEKLLLYNIIDDTVSILWQSVKSGLNNIFYKVNETKWLIAPSSSSSLGFLVYNTLDDSIINITSITSWGWQYFYKINENQILIGGGSNGFLLYNSDDDTIIKSYDQGDGWRFFTKVGNKILISSGYSNSGLLSYDIITKETNKIYDLGSAWSYTQVINNKCLLSATSSNSGILLYNSDDNTLSLIYDTGSYWQYANVINNKCLISSSVSAGTGLLVYNYEDDTIITLLNKGYNWKYFQNIKDKCLIGGANYSELYLYNPVDNNLTLLYGLNSAQYFKQVEENKCLIASSNKSTSNEGLYLYNSDTELVSKLGNVKGWGYDTFKQEEDNWYVSASDKTYSAFTLLYNSTDDSIKLVKYYIGEV